MATETGHIHVGLIRHMSEGNMKIQSQCFDQQFFASQGFEFLLSGLEQSSLGYFEMKLTVSCDVLC